MTGNSADRRTDKRGLNLQLRVFDALGSATTMLSVAEIAALIRVDHETVHGALRRLRKVKCLRSASMDGEFTYGLRPGAERPTDRRGGDQRRQREGQVTA